MADFNTHELALNVPVTTFGLTTGTWTLTKSGGIPKAAKSATAETTTVTVPVALPRLSGEIGVKIKKILLPYRATTADLSAAPTATLYQTNSSKAVAGAGTNVDSTTIASTNDGVVTNASTDRLLTVTVTNPAFDYSSTVPNVSYNLDVAFPCAAGTVLTVYDAIVIYDSAQ